MEETKDLSAEDNKLVLDHETKYSTLMDMKRCRRSSSKNYFNIERSGVSRTGQKSTLSNKFYSAVPKASDQSENRPLPCPPVTPKPEKQADVARAPPMSATEKDGILRKTFPLQLGKSQTKYSMVSFSSR